MRQPPPPPQIHRVLSVSKNGGIAYRRVLLTDGKERFEVWRRFVQMQPSATGAVGDVFGGGGWVPSTGAWPDTWAEMHDPPLSCNPRAADRLGIPLDDRRPCLRYPMRGTEPPSVREPLK